MNRVFFILVFVFISGFAGIIVAQEEKGAVDYNNEAVEAYKNKDYKTAYAAFSKAIELYKAEGSEVDINLTYNAGYCAYKSKKYNEAIPYFEEAIKSDFKESKPYVFIAQIYMNSDDLTSMDKILVEGLAKYNSDESLIKLAAVCYQRQGVEFYNKGNDIKKAANDSGMNETDPEAFEAEYAKANAEFEKALPLFEKSYEYNPKSNSTLKALQNIYTNLNMNDKASKMESEQATAED